MNTIRNLYSLYTEYGWRIADALDNTRLDEVVYVVFAAFLIALNAVSPLPSVQWYQVACSVMKATGLNNPFTVGYATYAFCRALLWRRVAQS